MKRDEIYMVLQSIALSQGPFSSIGFALDYIGTLSRSAQDEYWERLEKMNFQSRIDVLNYFLG